ncbi:glutathione S-transferase N-terminal domain-containing protein [Candidatus Nitrospira bockiana]
MTLYHVHWCPECALVREKLAALRVAYEDVVVPDVRPLRRQVFDVSGQYYVPVLKDGDTVLTETRDILAYLEERYGKPAGGNGGAGRRRREDEGPCCSL